MIVDLNGTRIGRMQRIFSDFFLIFLSQYNGTRIGGIRRIFSDFFSQYNGTRIGRIRRIFSDFFSDFFLKIQWYTDFSN